MKWFARNSGDALASFDMTASGALGFFPLPKRRLLVRPKHAPQHIARLTDRSVGAHAFQDIRHQVRVCPGGAGKSLKHWLDPGVVAPFLEIGELLPLMARHALV